MAGTSPAMTSGVAAARISWRSGDTDGPALSQIERGAAQDRISGGGVAAIRLVEHEARGQGHGRGAALAGENQDAPRRPAGAGPERKDRDPAGPPLEKGQEIAEPLRPMDQQQQALRPGELQRL